MDFVTFSNYLLRIVHIWSVHILKEEYYAMLILIYNRITKYMKIGMSEFETLYYYPKINVNIKRVKTPEEYEKETWEESEDKDCFELYDYDIHNEVGVQNEKNYKRPTLECYNINRIIFNYEEKIEYENFKADDFELVKPVLLAEEEIVIYGYPTQYILTYLKNNMKAINDYDERNKKETKFTLNSDEEEEESIREEEFKCEFYIDELRKYIKVTNRYKFVFSVDNGCNNNFIKHMKKDSKFILSWDIFAVNDSLQTNEDFVDDEMNLFNNIQMNNKFDRYLDLQEIERNISSNIVMNHEKILVNIDSLIIHPTYKKALETIIIEDKIGIKSMLWSESIYDKFNEIIKHKFCLLYKKISHLLWNIESYGAVIDSFREDLDLIKNTKLEQALQDFQYIKKFQSKVNIEYDRWNSDYDIIAEANRKVLFSNN
jgi:hypothetical protein